jgi:hypothetical protein
MIYAAFGHFFCVNFAEPVPFARLFRIKPCRLQHSQRTMKVLGGLHHRQFSVNSCKGILEQIYKK